MTRSTESPTAESALPDSKRIFRFWVPLAATWLMMAIEGPLLAAIIARLPDPKFNLAAHGVAWSLALIVEAPIIMMMTASVALVRDKQSYHKLLNFLHILNAGITACMLILLIPPVFDIVAIDIVGLPRNVASLTHTAVLLLLPWPSSIGYRRFFQGILINSNRTKLVAYGTMLRVATVFVVSFILYHTSLPGSAVGAITLSAAVMVESIVTRFMAAPYVKKVVGASSAPTPTTLPLSYRYLAGFYFPLAATSILGLGVHPMVTFFMGQSALPLESLAVLPVVNSLVFIFRSMGLSFQEVAITFFGQDFEGYAAVRRFALILAGTVIGGLGIIAFSPLEHIWYVTVSGLTPELADIAGIPTMILTIIPGMSVLLSFQRAILVNTRKTKYVTIASGMEVSLIILTLLFSVAFMNVIGVYAAAASFIIGRFAANTYLSGICKRIMRSLKSEPSETAP